MADERRWCTGAGGAAVSPSQYHRPSLRTMSGQRLPSPSLSGASPAAQSAPAARAARPVRAPAAYAASRRLGGPASAAQSMIPMLHARATTDPRAPRTPTSPPPGTLRQLLRDMHDVGSAEDVVASARGHHGASGGDGARACARVGVDANDAGAGSADNSGAAVSAEVRARRRSPVRTDSEHARRFGGVEGGRSSYTELAAPELPRWEQYDHAHDSLLARLEELKMSAGRADVRTGQRRMLDKELFDENEQAVGLAIMPDSAFKARWDALVLLTLALSCVFSPLLAAFAPDLALDAGGHAWLSAAGVLVVIVLALDVAVSARTAFMDDGVYIRLPRLILAHYAASYHLPLDLLAALPLRTVLTRGGSCWRIARDGDGAPARASFFELVCLWDLFKLNKLYRTLDALRDGARVQPAVASLAKLLLGLAYMWIWTGTMYFYVASAETARHAALGHAPGAFGPHNYFPPTAPVALKVARSIFWGISVTANIGPDILPETFVEVLFTTLCSLLSTSVYALTIGSAATSFTELQAPLLARRRRLEQLNEYMRYKRVPVRLQERVNSFFDYRGLSLLGIVSDGDVMAKMPLSLSAQLSIALNQSLFSQVPLFQECSANLLLAMVSRLVPLIHMPGDLIIRQGTEGKALHFINRGQCLVLKTIGTPAGAAPCAPPSHDGGAVASGEAGARAPERAAAHRRSPLGRALSRMRPGSGGRGGGAPEPILGRQSGASTPRPLVEFIALLGESEFFGEGALLSRGVTAATVRAVTYCDLLALFAHDFHLVVRDFPYFAVVVDEHAAALHRRSNVPLEQRVVLPDPAARPDSVAQACAHDAAVDAEATSRSPRAQTPSRRM
ncbi:hypothetical protein KFE25_009532 [Diacronema lutheri]|uniref:Cyclic nucleotide-binding domain-containing protein n=4 Tax=Diacronema lutheri TaxID=2081491 RepID=A0A8J6CHG0_DIALT|nr:hypothetical protein KFE25_009532 [Diacronema lutheri]